MEKYLACFSARQLDEWRKVSYDNLIVIKPDLIKMGYPDNLTDAKFCFEVNQALWRMDNRYSNSLNSLLKGLGR